MRLSTIKAVYGEESNEYKEALKACEESAERVRKICDAWRYDLNHEKVRAGR